MSMLNIEDLNVYYGSIHALKGVSLEVNEGEIVTLIGANGAGKSTLLKTVSGLLKPKAGSIDYMKKSIAGRPAQEIVKAGITQVPEGRRVFAEMSVEENIQLGAFLRKDKVELQHQRSSPQEFHVGAQGRPKPVRSIQASDGDEQA